MAMSSLACIFLFGALVVFRPSPAAGKNTNAVKEDGRMKFSTKGRWGIFMGWVILSGGEWHHTYSVLPLRALCFQDFSVNAKCAANKNYFQSTQCIEWFDAENVQFPCWSKYLKANSTLEGMERGILLKRGKGVRRLPLNFWINDPDHPGHLITVGD